MMLRPATKCFRIPRAIDRGQQVAELEGSAILCSPSTTLNLYFLRVIDLYPRIMISG